MAIDIVDLRLNKLKVQFVNEPIADISSEVSNNMNKIRASIQPGMRIALAVGSRGIANIALIVKSVSDVLVSWGAQPFIVPAMGSHGGATAEGQIAILAEYGITSDAMGVPIHSSMSVKHVGQLTYRTAAVDLFMDEYAYDSDGVIVINRIKAHTDFHGPNESGIAKMLSIGLGKHAQALAVHEHMIDGLIDLIPKVAEAIIHSGKVIGAVAIVEDGYDQTTIIEVVPGGEIVSADARLLLVSKSMMPSLPFDQLDVLLVDWMGKNISGTGMDTNIIGRLNIRGQQDGSPFITRICLFDLTPECHGNALGIGLADIIPQSLYTKIDWRKTYENVLTSRIVERGFTPIVRSTDDEVVRTALMTCGYHTQDTLKLARIKDTLHIDEIYVTDALLEEALSRSNVILLERNLPLNFDATGSLPKL